MQQYTAWHIEGVGVGGYETKLKLTKTKHKRDKSGRRKSCMQIAHLLTIKCRGIFDSIFQEKSKYIVRSEIYGIY
jgi:hypothetical protein